MRFFGILLVLFSVVFAETAVDKKTSIAKYSTRVVPFDYTIPENSGTVTLEIRLKDANGERVIFPPAPLPSGQHIAIDIEVTQNAVLYVLLDGAKAKALQLDEDGTWQDQFVVTLTRGACSNACPVYSVSIDQTGTIRWNGTKLVTKKGKASVQVSLERIEKVKKALKEYKFWNLKNEYLEKSIADQASISIGVTSDARFKKIQHYLGDKNAPKSLFDLEKELDLLLETKKWVGR